jgi:hypothetical protein
MRKKKGVMDGSFTSDPVKSTCLCGKPVHYLYRGNIKLIPGGHKCKYRDAQRDEVRTIKAEESAGINVTPSEAARRINDALRD